MGLVDGVPAPRAGYTQTAGRTQTADQCPALIAAARAHVERAVAEARTVLSDLWSGLIETMTAGVEHAQHVMDVAAHAPSDHDDPAWLDCARELGWRG